MGLRAIAGGYEFEDVREEQEGVHCNLCEWGWCKRTEEALAHIGQPCRAKACAERGGVHVEYHRVYEFEQKVPVCGCGDRQTVQERYSFGCYAGLWCDRCWPLSGYRDATDPRAEFDPADAGEQLEEEPAVGGLF